ncbi:hypothetical protein RvY_05665 [Ramazzottius varieornatus]|uniref:Uncharacterized protein n=1 Tax=Ramazzottius varieornatus TaxID=947166 RepID=A0A1D1UVU2_RAMVA|nr:hypothetical protein RvY_05665 [Ramazzottius varieornatus]
MLSTVNDGSFAQSGSGSGVAFTESHLSYNKISSPSTTRFSVAHISGSLSGQALFTEISAQLPAGLNLFFSLAKTHRKCVPKRKLCRSLFRKNFRHGLH